MLPLDSRRSRDPGALWSEQWHEVTNWQGMGNLGLSTHCAVSVNVSQYVGTPIFGFQQMESALYARVSYGWGSVCPNYEFAPKCLGHESTTSWACNGDLMCRCVGNFFVEVPGYGIDKTVGS